MKRIIVSIGVLMTAACVVSSAASAATVASIDRGYDCDYASTDFMKVAESKFAKKCFAPRGDAEDFVSIPLDIAEFGTKCAVKVRMHTDVPQGHPCYSTKTSIQLYDRVLVNDWGNGVFTLTRLRDNAIVPLSPGPAAHGAIPFLHGTLDGVMYAVYLEHVPAIAGDTRKVYRIETFDLNASTQCNEHKPTHAPAVVDCDPNGPTLGAESSTSTGGEPPPK